MTAEATAETTPARPRVPVWRTVGAAYRDTFGNLAAFLMMAALPFAASILLSAVLTTNFAGLTYELLGTLIEPLPAAVFECLWFRYLLLSGEERRPGLLPRPQRRLLTFLGYTFLLALLFVPMVLISNLAVTAVAPELQMTGILGLPLLIIAVYFYLRLCFALPWIAVDAEGRLRESWQRTRGNGLRLLIVTFLVTLPPMLLIGLVAVISHYAAGEAAAEVTADDFSEPGIWIFGVIFQSATYVIYAINVAVIARAFCLLTGWQTNRQEILERFE